LSARKRALRSVQRQLERFYALESAPDVVDFVRTGEPAGRETLVLRQAEDALEIRLLLPPLDDLGSLDRFLQLVEGVSHFVYVAERARTNLPATRLELELQAEVDKFVVLARGGRIDSEQARTLHARLYERVRYLHPPGSEDGDRYRLANDLAARFVARLLERSDAAAGVVRTLRRFYRSGQAEKIHLARAA
jgi:hypothetical protein